MHHVYLIFFNIRFKNVSSIFQKNPQNLLAGLLSQLGGTLANVIVQLTSGLQLTLSQLNLPSIGANLAPIVQTLFNCLASNVTGLLKNVLGTLSGILATLGTILPIGTPNLLGLLIPTVLQLVSNLLGGQLGGLLGIL